MGGSTLAASSVGSVVELTPEQMEQVSESACNARQYGARHLDCLAVLVDLSESMNTLVADGPSSRWTWAMLELNWTFSLLSTLGPRGAPLVSVQGFPSHIHGSPSSDTHASCVDLADRVPLTQITAAGFAAWSDWHKMAQPGGKSPIVDAYRATVEQLKIEMQQAGSCTRGAVVLVTDGLPTLDQGCVAPSTDDTDNVLVDSAAIVAAMGEAALGGLQTIVVGTAGSEGSRDWLSKAADAGNTGSFDCPASDATTPCFVDGSRAETANADLYKLLKPRVDERDCHFVFLNETTDGLQSIDGEHLATVITYDDGRNELLHLDEVAGQQCVEGLFMSEPNAVALCAQTCERWRADPKATITFVSDCGDGPEITGIQ